MTSKRLNSKLLRAHGICAVAIISLLTGCDREKIQVYRVAKEESQPPSVSPDSQMPEGHPDISGASAPPRLTWRTPDGWNEVIASDFRVASFNVKSTDGRQADVSVIPLPGAAGGDVANVNRWRGQVGLQPLSPEVLKNLAQTVEVAGQPAELYEQAGKNPGSGDATRILAAIQHRGGTAWFFKMTGDDKLVSEQKPVFVEFLKSLSFVAQDMAALPASQPPIDGGTLPVGHPDISSELATSARTPSAEGRPNWQVPADWKETPAGQILTAKFIVTGDGNAQAAINISTSAGDGGGLEANVNRWRKQLGLGELSSEEINKSVKTIEGVDGRISIVEMSGADARSGQPALLIGAVVPKSGQTWFYKFMGDSAVVESQRETFTRFVQSVKY